MSEFDGPNYAEMQIDSVKNLLSRDIPPNGADSAGVGDVDAFNWAKGELSIPSDHSDEHFLDNGLYRKRTYKTKLPDTFYIETATKGSDGQYRVCAREIIRIGAKAMEMNAEDIARIGVPVFL